MRAARVIALAVIVAAMLLSACAEETVPAANPNECVILLHGLARTAFSMQRMKRSLEGNGYRVANVDYPSRDHKIEVLAPLAIKDGLQQCGENSETSAVHFVTHSLGGILVRVSLTTKSPISDALSCLRRQTRAARLSMRWNVFRVLTG